MQRRRLRQIVHRLPMFCSLNKQKNIDVVFTSAQHSPSASHVSSQVGLGQAQRGLLSAGYSKPFLGVVSPDEQGQRNLVNPFMRH